jgi:hypothetical protein
VLLGLADQSLRVSLEGLAPVRELRARAS